MKYSAIILAAGSGTRTGLDFNKIFYVINGKKILDYSIDFFMNQDLCNDVILVVSEADFQYINTLYNDKKITIVKGGNSRQESVYNSLNKAVNDVVLIHDSARPFINSLSVTNLLQVLVSNVSATLGVKVKDTINISDGNRLVKTLNRDSLIALQTPQGFHRDVLIKAHDLARKDNFAATDDTALIKKYDGIDPVFVLGDYRSIKLTTLEDLKYLEVIL